MKKQTIIKIISRMIVSVFLLCLIVPISPVNAATSAGANASLYSNPNQDNSKNPFPYKFKMSDVVNAQMLTSVIGCTGVVNTTAKWMSGLLQSKDVKEQITDKSRTAAIDAAKAACVSGKVSADTTADSAPTMPGYSTAVNTALEIVGVKIGGTTVKTCLQSVDAMNLDEIDKLTKILKEDKAKTFKEQCFDGIAITLAKNQLTAMARSTMNWVNSGYGGNPFFVQNMRNLTYNIEKNVVETGIDVLLAPKNASPYAADFARSTINSQGIVSSSSRFLGGLQSDLSNFISDPRSYYSNDNLKKANTTQDALLRAQQANDAFARDFSLGGWNGWLALTQREKNNPLGFNMLASQYLSDMQTQAVSDQKAEITQNGGFMSQKECIEWQVFNKDGSIKDANMGGSSVVIPTLVKAPYKYQRKDGEHEYTECFNFKTITPGSLIKDKVGNYLNSPDRQLELVKTINDGLNVLFSALISKLQNGGLTSLSDSAVATNWTDNMNSLTGGSSGSAYDNNGAYDGFSLASDLGNTYIHSPTTNLGTWNADANTATLSSDSLKVYPKEINTTIGLYPSTAPEIYIYNTNTKEKELSYPTNPFYTVTVAGKTTLMIDGYNGWEVGDRAFFDGTKWQNWKKGQQSPIAKRGVIQIQQDYIVAAKEILGILPNTMTSLGELDYCIPGPNPSYKTNSTDAQSAYQGWINSIYTGPLNQDDTDRLEWKIDRENSSSYKTLANIFTDSPNVWKKLTSSNAIAWFLNYFGPFTGTKNMGTISYSWKGDAKAKYQEAVKLQKFTTDYTNNYLFQNFYEVFDKAMNKLYFNNMTTKYLETEDSAELKPNPGYLPVAINALDLTKDILYYNDELMTASDNYMSGIEQARVNVAKLDPIKTEVLGIIKAAQDRRNKELVKNLGLTENEIKTKYSNCFKEENLSFYDADTILATNTNSSETRCNDGIDNDMDGLVDGLDPDCIGKTQNTGTGAGANFFNTITRLAGSRVNMCNQPAPVVVSPTVYYANVMIATQNIPKGTMGTVITGGYVKGFNISGLGDGLIYLSTTSPGKLTSSDMGKSIKSPGSLLVGHINLVEPAKNGSIVLGSGAGGSTSVQAGEDIQMYDVVWASSYEKPTATRAGYLVVKKALGSK